MAGQTIPRVLPILPVRETVLFPKATEIIKVSKEHSKLLADLPEKYKLVGVISKTEGNFEKVGTVGKVRGIGAPADILQRIAEAVRLKFGPDQIVESENLLLAVEGISRFKILRIVQDTPYYLAEVQILSDVISSTADELAVLIEAIRTSYRELLDLASISDGDELFKTVMESKDPGSMVDFIAANTPPWVLSLEDKQAILEALDVKERLKKVNYFLTRAVIAFRARERVREEVGATQKEFIIREQIKALDEELAKMGKERKNPEVQKYHERAKEANLPPEVRKELEEELKRFAQADPHDPTNQFRRAWLDWMLALPWNKSTVDRSDLKEAEQILEEDHWGLERVKKRVVEFLAVKKLKPEGKSPILCFIGPPGTGKTSVGRSIARAMNRKFIRISLGGAKDERQIRGFERTYLGAMPGVIIQEIKRAEANNPVFMIDEIDKVGADWRGDPTSALLEVLDPEQNFAFQDHYLGIPFDLSKVMFICTGNLIDPIQPALRDRMEILEFPGYTLEEKLIIAEKYLVPRQIEANGLRPDQIRFETKIIELVIKDYSREAGVRNLEREIGNICRRIATRVAKGEISQEIVNEEKLRAVLGVRKYLSTLKERVSRPGVAIGLAWTATGGTILFVETEIVRGVKKDLKITGNVAKIMQESAETALTFVEANVSLLKISEDQYPMGQKIHIHIPEAAIPKDGPSAGITVLTALVSLLTGRKVKDSVAMTGEITLRGKILPVGGIKGKVLAAQEAGIKVVILPAENRKDEEELPRSVKKAIEQGEIELKYVSEMREAIELALEN